MSQNQRNSGTTCWKFGTIPYFQTKFCSSSTCMTFIFHGFAMKWEVGNKQREEKGEKERSLLEAYMNYMVKGSVMYFKVWAWLQVRTSSQKLCTLHFWMRVPIWIMGALWGICLLGGVCHCGGTHVKKCTYPPDNDRSWIFHNRPKQNNWPR